MEIIQSTKSAVKIFFTLLTVHCSLIAVGQPRSFGIINTNPNPKASLDVGVTPGFKQGMLMPRLTTADTNNIGVAVGKDKGMMFYDTTAGIVRWWDGAKWNTTGFGSSSGSAPTMQLFKSGSGTYVTPSGVKWIRVRMVGGGGGGAGSNGSTIPGSGGGAGGYVESIITNPASSYSYSVGAGGVGGAVNNSGGTGGPTSFGSNLANGGLGGGAWNGDNFGGDGGTATLGLGTGVAIKGNGGIYAYNTNSGSSLGRGGAGGAGVFGGAGAGTSYIASADANSGAGGGGAVYNLSGSAGNGGSGIILVEEYYGSSGGSGGGDSGTDSQTLSLAGQTLSISNGNSVILPTSGGNPAGTVISYAGASVPTGYLVCDGSAVSRSTYSDLFTAIGTAWGAGNGTTTFNLPDLRGRFLRGVDGGSGNNPNAATRTASGTSGNTGNNVGSLQGDAFQGHNHTFQYGWSANWEAIGTWVNGVYDNSHGTNNNTRTDIVTNPVTDGTNGTPRTATETRPKNVYVIYVIKY